MPFFPNVELREPWFLAVAVLAIPIFFFYRKAPGHITFSSAMLLPARKMSMRLRLAWLPDALLGFAAIALGIALAGPRTGDHQADVKKTGIAIMMVVDTSSSMQALDLSDDNNQTRLDIVKKIFEEFVAGKGDLGGRANDAIGLVSFARYADSRVPLTLDHNNLITLARDLRIAERDEDGTAIGDGLGLALERLRVSKAKSKVVILLTDGVNNKGDTAPLAAAETAETLGIKVYTVGAGTNGMAAVRVLDPRTGRKRLRRTMVQIDEKTLRAIAVQTKGKYFRATSGDSLRKVYETIDKLERSEVTEQRYMQYHEHYGVLTAMGLAFAALGWLLRSSWLRRLP